MRNQLSLNLDKGTHGGRRTNAGRKRKLSKGISHDLRERVFPQTPLHINFKYNTYIKSEQVLQIFILSLQNAKKHGLSILQYSIQSNHVHLIVEAEDNSSLERGMRSLTNTMVKRIQSLKQIKGTIQIERYHLHILKTPKETYNAFQYVAFNERRHTGTQKIDQYSSINGFVKLDEPTSWLAKKANQKLLLHL